MSKTSSPSGVLGGSDPEALDEGLWEAPVEQQPEADQESVARKILFDQLTGRSRTKHELAVKLASKNVPAELSKRLLDRFEEVGLIDDLAFSKLWVTTRQSTRGLTRRVLAQELRRKGVADDVAALALEEVDSDDEEASARELVRKKLPSLAHVDRATATRRLIGQLARKGHSPGLAAHIVREEFARASREAVDADDDVEFYSA